MPLCLANTDFWYMKTGVPASPSFTVKRAEVGEGGLEVGGGSRLDVDGYF